MNLIYIPPKCDKCSEFADRFSAADSEGQGAVAGAARSLHDADQIVIVRKGEQPNIVRLTWEKFREGESDRFCDLIRVPGYPMFESAALPGGRR